MPQISKDCTWFYHNFTQFYAAVVYMHVETHELLFHRRGARVVRSARSGCSGPGRRRWSRRRPRKSLRQKRDFLIFWSSLDVETCWNSLKNAKKICFNWLSFKSQKFQIQISLSLILLREKKWVKSWPRHAARTGRCWALELDHRTNPGSGWCSQIAWHIWCWLLMFLCVYRKNWGCGAQKGLDTLLLLYKK